MNTYEVVIIGGGLAGLSAAVELTARGRKVLVLEQHAYSGGRTHSFVDAGTSDVIDNGQHLMMGCYFATRHYLQLIGTQHLADLQPNLQIQFLHPSHGSLRFSCPKMPTPFHLLGGILDFTVIPLMERLKMFSVAQELLFTSAKKEAELDRLTADEWLKNLKQPEAAKKYFWDVLTIGALNNHPGNVSALMLFRVLRAAFLGRRRNSSLLIPRVSLSELFVDPAVRFIDAGGGLVQTGTGASRLITDHARIHSLVIADGTEIQAPFFISAVPWHAYESLYSQTPHQRQQASPFHPSPIIAIQLWFDRTVTDLDFAALLDTRIQWLFNRSRLPKNEKKSKRENLQSLSLVISDAKEFVGLSKDELIQLAVTDLCKVLPLAKEAKVVHSVVIKEKRATFIPSPGLEDLRPQTRTEYSNLFLAGDWTATGYPATIEGAIMSGKKAADMCSDYFT